MFIISKERNNKNYGHYKRRTRNYSLMSDYATYSTHESSGYGYKNERVLLTRLCSEVNEQIVMLFVMMLLNRRKLNAIMSGYYFCVSISVIH